MNDKDTVEFGGTLDELRREEKNKHWMLTIEKSKERQLSVSEILAKIESESKGRTPPPQTQPQPVQMQPQPQQQQSELQTNLSVQPTRNSNYLVCGDRRYEINTRNENKVQHIQADNQIIEITIRPTADNNIVQLDADSAANHHHQSQSEMSPKPITSTREDSRNTNHGDSKTAKVSSKRLKQDEIEFAQKGGFIGDAAAIAASKQTQRPMPSVSSPLSQQSQAIRPQLISSTNRRRTTISNGSSSDADELDAVAAAASTQTPTSSVSSHAAEGGNWFCFYFCFSIFKLKKIVRMIHKDEKIESFPHFKLSFYSFFL